MKNIKMLLGSLAIAAILGVNGYMAVGSSKAASELTLGGVEMMAEGEDPNGNSDITQGDFYTFQCNVDKVIQADAKGIIVIGGFVLHGKANEIRRIKFTYTAGNCGGDPSKSCIPIKCDA